MVSAWVGQRCITDTCTSRPPSSSLPLLTEIWFPVIRAQRIGDSVDLLPHARADIPDVYVPCLGVDRGPEGVPRALADLGVVLAPLQVSVLEDSRGRDMQEFSAQVSVLLGGEDTLVLGALGVRALVLRLAMIQPLGREEGRARDIFTGKIDGRDQSPEPARPVLPHPDWLTWKCDPSPAP